MAFFQGDYDRAAALWEESLALFRDLGDTIGIAYSYGNLGLVADAQDDYERAIASYEQALALFRQLDDRTYIALHAAQPRPDRLLPGGLRARHDAVRGIPGAGANAGGSEQHRHDPRQPGARGLCRR